MYSTAIRRPVAKRIIVYVLVASIAGLLIVSPLFLSIPVHAVMLPSLLKLRTIGELIITLFAGAGTAITNPIVVPQIYQSAPYTIEYLVEEDILNLTDYPDSTNEEVITELGNGKAFNLDTQGFRELMNTNWQSMRDLQIDTVLRVNDIANTDSVYGAIDNIGGILTNVCEYGYLGFENSIAIVTNPLTSVSVGLGNVKESFMRVFGSNINYGIGIESRIPADVINYSLANNKRIIYTNFGGSSTGGKYYDMYAAIDEDIKFASYTESEYTMPVIGKNNGDANSDYKVWRYIGNRLQRAETSTIYKGEVKTLIYPTGVGNFGIPNASKPTFLSEQDARNYINSPDLIDSRSPDIIGQIGNINSEDINTGINEGQGIDIIDSTTYNNFVDEANENTDSGNYDDNEILYDDLINQNSADIPEPEPIPVVPVQPTSFPTRPTITPEQSIESLKGAVPGITEYFPFCIPSDLVALFTHLNVTDREAPKVIWEWNIPGRGISETIEVDLSRFDSVASICRILELIMFIYGLIVGTRAIIGA